MEQTTEQAAWQAFVDTVGMWRTARSGTVPDLVRSATELLVVGLDTPHLRALAGASVGESMWVIEPLLLATLDELGAEALLDGTPERASLQAMLRRFLRRQIALRELSSWAHVAIGHDGETVLQPFVELDDIYDDWEAAGFDLSELDRVARTAAEEFLATGATEALDDVYAVVEQPSAYTVVQQPSGESLPSERRWWHLRR